MTDPRILIFGDATSALHYHSERIVNRNMAQIVIAHLFSALRVAHRILTINAACSTTWTA